MGKMRAQAGACLCQKSRPGLLSGCLFVAMNSTLRQFLFLPKKIRNFEEELAQVFFFNCIQTIKRGDGHTKMKFNYISASSVQDSRNTVISKA